MAKKALLSNKCVMSANVVFGDRRYRYQAARCMSPAERTAAFRRYPHSTGGIPDMAYAYPITKTGEPASARRALLWKYEHVKRKVGKHKAKSLSGARRRRRR